MKGSEKQISWAKDIINQYNDGIQLFKKYIDAEGTGVPEDQQEFVISMIDKAWDKLNTLDAPEIIDHRYFLTVNESNFSRETKMRSVGTGEIVGTMPFKMINLVQFQKNICTIANHIIKRM